MLVATGALAAADPPAAALLESAVGLELEHAARGSASTAIPAATRTRVLLFIVVLSGGTGSEDGEDRGTRFCPARCCGGAGLIDEHGGERGGADGSSLPESLDAEEDEPGLEHGGD